VFKHENEQLRFGPGAAVRVTSVLDKQAIGSKNPRTL
jgi:hypothetical protein